MRERREGLIVNLASMAGKAASSMSGPGHCSSGGARPIALTPDRNGKRPCSRTSI
jgi:hypothetical protein